MGNQSRVGFSTGKKLLVTKRNMRSGSGALSTWGTNLFIGHFQPTDYRHISRATTM